MKESEARVTWCPKVQIVIVPENPLSLVNNRSGPNYDSDNCNCLGSGCMAWRCDLSFADPDRNPRPGADGTEGYCGLAGKP